MIIFFHKSRFIKHQAKYYSNSIKVLKLLIDNGALLKQLSHQFGATSHQSHHHPPSLAATIAKQEVRYAIHGYNLWYCET